MYVLKTVNSGDGIRDDLVVAHAESDRTWILSTQPQIVDPDKTLEGDAQRVPLGFNEASSFMISEFSASNETNSPMRTAEYHDWVEIYNRSGEAQSLAGWKLSDSLKGQVGWEFPTRWCLLGSLSWYLLQARPS